MTAIPPNDSRTSESVARKNALSEARRREVSELAEFLADDHSPSGPVDLELILNDSGITTSFGRYGDFFDGMLECRDGRFHVFCNLNRVDYRSSGRARFTLGHELGHYYIDEHRTALLSGVEPHGSRCDYESRNPVEQEADLFASHLLLPTERLRDASSRHSRGIATILALANEYETSLTSAAIRYVQTDLAPCTAIKWDLDGFGWKWFSPSTFRAGFRKTIESRDNLPGDCATERALSGADPPSTGFHSCGSTASLWFPFVSDASARNIIMVEEAISLGRFGALTMLYPESGDYEASF